MKRLEVWLVRLDPTLGKEIKKTRPAVIISPNEMNTHSGTVLVAPMTTKSRAVPTRVACTFQSKKGEVALEQIRTVDKKRLVKRLGKLSDVTGTNVLRILREMFEE